MVTTVVQLANFELSWREALVTCIAFKNSFHNEIKAVKREIMRSKDLLRIRRQLVRSASSKHHTPQYELWHSVCAGPATECLVVAAIPEAIAIVASTP